LLQIGEQEGRAKIDEFKGLNVGAMAGLVLPAHFEEDVLGFEVGVDNIVTVD
jgi:hypothetical protein